MTTKGPPISTEGLPVPTGGLLIPRHEDFCFFAILHLSFSSFGKRFCGSAKVVRFELISNFRGGNATPASRQGWQSATPAPMVAPPLQGGLFVKSREIRYQKLSKDEKRVVSENHKREKLPKRSKLSKVRLVKRRKTLKKCNSSVS